MVHEPLEESLKLMRGNAHRPMAKLGTFQPDFPREFLVPAYHTFNSPQRDFADARPVLHSRLGLLSAGQY